ncbi:MAG: hypothetical protein RLZZ244_3166 [Verrucomicrobiota bacterium]|jgi:hypothetical protein
MKSPLAPSHALLAVTLLSLSLTGCASLPSLPSLKRFNPLGLFRSTPKPVPAEPAPRKPAHSKTPSPFPTSLAIAPIQFKSGTTAKHLRALDADRKLEFLKSLPEVRSVSILGPVIVPEDEKKSDQAVREAASKVHADMVLALSVDHEISESDVFAPLTLVSLGLLPTQRYEVVATAVATLVDTRTGYVFGTFEKSRVRRRFTIAWGSSDRIEGGIETADRDALRKLLKEVPSFWNGVLATYRR